MTDTPIADGIHHHERPAANIITPLRAIADAIEVNPLARKLLETGVGQRLSSADVETVFRSALAIEAAHQRIPEDMSSMDADEFAGHMRRWESADPQGLHAFIAKHNRIYGTTQIVQNTGQ